MAKHGFQGQPHGSKSMICFKANREIKSTHTTSMTSGFCQKVDENFTLLGYYAVSSGNVTFPELLGGNLQNIQYSMQD